MSNTVTVTTAEGSFTIRGDLLKEYRQRAFEALDAEAEAKQNFKDEVEALADGADSTTIEGKKLQKILGAYLKSAYKEKTKEAAELGEIFGSLDSVLEA